MLCILCIGWVSMSAIPIPNQCSLLPSITSSVPSFDELLLSRLLWLNEMKSQHTWITIYANTNYMPLLHWHGKFLLLIRTFLCLCTPSPVKGEVDRTSRWHGYYMYWILSSIWRWRSIKIRIKLTHSWIAKFDKRTGLSNPLKHDNVVMEVLTGAVVVVSGHCRTTRTKVTG